MKTKITVFFTLLIMLCSISTVFAAKKTPVSEKNTVHLAKNNYSKPFSIFLSVVVPGMGQIYSGQPEKGLAIWSSSAILLGAFLINSSELDFRSMSGPLPFNFGFRFKENMSERELFWSIGLGATYVFLYIYNVVDISVYDRNADKYISLDIDDNNIHASYSIKF